MDQSELFENLKNKDLYGADVNSVDILQTHISFVALTGKYAYKIKKPVNFGFLDFSTLEKRKYFCEEEIRLNKRLCPEIYLDVVPITKKNSDLEFAGDGEVVDYAVKMKEFSQENIMLNLIRQDKIDEAIIEKIADILVNFYSTSRGTDEINKFGSVELVKNNTAENFEQTANVIGVTIEKDIYDFIKNATDDFLEQKKDLFEKRISDGCIKDCHGDLHTGNIVVSPDDIYIFDCIEFNERFRYGDVASDIAFLAMDLDYQGRPYLSSFLVDQYVEKSGDAGIYDLLNFYKCYRAYVRGKVIGFKLNDPSICTDEKQGVISTCKKYYDLAQYYASLFSKQMGENKPILFVTSGLTGTGKTTAARKISVDYNAKMISTDSVRKELEGIDRYERHHESYNTGLYSPEKMQETYGKILKMAENHLKTAKNVVLDATFKTKELRHQANDIAKKTNSRFLIINTSCPEKIVKNYLEERVKKKSISDGRWEIYVKQKKSFETFENEGNVVKIDVFNKSYDYQDNVFRKILEKTIEA